MRALDDTIPHPARGGGSAFTVGRMSLRLTKRILPSLCFGSGRWRIFRPSVHWHTFGSAIRSRGMKFLTTRPNSRKTARTHEASRWNEDLYRGPLAHHPVACVELFRPSPILYEGRHSNAIP